MKKHLITLLLIFPFLSLQAQRNLNLKDFNTWSIQGNLNSNLAHTDIVQNKPFYSDVDMSFGYGLRVTKFLTHHFALSLDNYRTSLSGSRNNWSYQTDIRYQTAILAQLQTGNIRYTNALSKFQLYGYLGYGTVNFRAVAENSNRPSQNTELKGNSQVIPIGMGLKYHLAENATLNLEYSLNRMDGDELDGYVEGLSEYDSYSRLSIGFSWTLGKKDNLNLEWHDPRPRFVAPAYKKDTLVIIQQIPAVDSNSIAQKNRMSDSELINAVRDSVRIDMLSTTVYYEFNKWKLPKAHHSILGDMALEVLNNPNLTIKIDSYCDTIGTTQNNAIIVSKRAEQVKNYLLTYGVSESNIFISHHGEEDAIFANDAENRRTVVRFKKD